MVGVTQAVRPRDGALAATIGPLLDEPDAGALTDADRSRIEYWRGQRWEALERRAGKLAVRDAATWYERLAFERWRGDGDTAGCRRSRSSSSTGSSASSRARHSCGCAAG